MKAIGFGLRIGAAVIGVVAAANLSTAFAQDAQGPSQGQSQAPNQAPNAPPTLAPNDAASSMVGTWELSNGDRDRVCRLVFRVDPGPGGSRLDVDKNCPAIFPSTKDVTAWSADGFGTVRLNDARGRVVIELTEAESGIFDGFARGEGRYVLQSAAAAPAHTADDMVGEWALVRASGKPMCKLTLANNAAGADNLELKVKPGCDGTVTRFAPSSWRMDQGDLVLFSARGQTWRFEENDSNTWQRVPETADPILLTR